MAKLSHLRQTSGGRQRSSKGELADALDGLFSELGPVIRDRVAGNLIQELLQVRPTHAERLNVLLGRVGWTVFEGEPIPLELRLDTLPRPIPDAVRRDLLKGLQRYRDGDLDGAMTAIVATVDTLTAEVYGEHSLGNHRQHPYQQRVVLAHGVRENAFRASLSGMGSEEITRTWKAQSRAVSGAAEVLACYRRNYSDVHGATHADQELIKAALQGAVFIIHSLST